MTMMMAELDRTNMSGQHYHQHGVPQQQSTLVNLERDRQLLYGSALGHQLGGPVMSAHTPASVPVAISQSQRHIYDSMLTKTSPIYHMSPMRTTGSMNHKVPVELEIPPPPWEKTTIPLTSSHHNMPVSAMGGRR
jgi:hypothetical protein